jgi:hypothetical protein
MPADTYSTAPQTSTGALWLDTLLAENATLKAERDTARAEVERAKAAADGVDLREGHVRDNADPDQLRAMLLGAGLKIAKLQAFKDWVHKYLDDHGVPHHPPGTHGAEGCRIGDRMDWLMNQCDELAKEVERLKELLWTLHEGIYGHRKAEGYDPFDTAVRGALEVKKVWDARG